MKIFLPRLIAIAALIAALSAIKQVEQMTTPRTSEVCFAIAIVVSATILALS